MHQFFSATDERKKHDFIDRGAQMRSDLTELKTRLNALWVKPIREFETLLYKEKNARILAKYDIEF